MSRHEGTELFLLLTCVLSYIGYHVWMFTRKDSLSGGSPSNWFNVYGTSSTAKLVWTHGCAMVEGDAITAVQTLRNALLVVALMSQATAYIGARALPDVLFNEEYRSELTKLAYFLVVPPCTVSLHLPHFELISTPYSQPEIDPITGGSGNSGIVSATAKTAVGLALIWACILCLGQAARFYVHLGFMVKVVNSRYNTEQWGCEEETLAVAHQAGLYYSIAWRVFYAFGLSILYLPGITCLLLSTMAMMVMLYFSDNLPRYRYSKALMRINKSRAGPEPPGSDAIV